MTSDFLITYGYPFIFLGSLMEGEITVFYASILSKENIFNVYYAFLYSLLGCVISDQIMFIVGKLWGVRIVKFLGQRMPQVNAINNSILKKIQKHEKIFIFSFRFIIGIRFIAPIVLGMHKISHIKFFILNILSAILWVTIIFLIGYCFGEIISQLPSNYKYILYIITGVIIYFSLKKMNQEHY